MKILTVKQGKKAFLDKYNPKRSEVVAVSKAIEAAVQHNSLYRSEATSAEKLAVRCEWRHFLQSKQKKYKTSRIERAYEYDIQALANLMNNSWSSVFRNAQHDTSNLEPGFRISHAQKSLGVYLKHLWCMGIIAEPPQCPVDRIILGKAGAKYPANKWGYVNSLPEHRAKIKILRDALPPRQQSLAKWEVNNFK